MRKLFSIFLLLFCGSAVAAPVTLFGDDVSFSYDDATLYGTATVVGNSIFFNPVSFIAQSANTDGTVTLSETLDITVVATTAGFSITDLLLAENGDYFLNGDSTSVDVTGTFTAISQTTAFSDSNALSGGALTTQGVLTEWMINSAIGLGDTAGWGQDTSIMLTLENELEAISNALGESATIQKKFGAFGVAINPVIPIPATLWLFGSALGLLGWVRRTR